MKYWVIINNEKLGPLTAEELAQIHICADTPVWRAGLADWKRAGELPELEAMVNLRPTPPPPVPRPRILYGPSVPGAPAAPDDSRNKTPMPDTYLAWSIIVTLLCCIPCGIAAIYFSAQVSSRYEGGDLKGAEKCSERAQLWIILSIVLGLITTPFLMLSML